MNTKNDQQALSGAGQTAPRRKSLSEKAGYQNRGTGKNPVTAAEGQEVPKYRKGSLSEKANINVLKPDEEFIKSYQITVH